MSKVYKPMNTDEEDLLKCAATNGLCMAVVAISDKSPGVYYVGVRHGALFKLALQIMLGDVIEYNIKARQWEYSNG